MKLGLLQKILMVPAMAILALGVAGATTTGTPAAGTDADIAKRLTHEVRMYPRYTIWDNVNFRVQDGHVELLGEVSQPFKKGDLGRIAKSVAGVNSVTNSLKVLPLSPMDDRLRLQVARAIYGYPTLSRYALGALPPIHIIVDNGHVTLEGVVGNEQDKQIAGMRASGAGLGFGAVVNNLRVENPSPHKG
jgi:hyperosmotically inducible periplasmic protein